MNTSKKLALCGFFCLLTLFFTLHAQNEFSSYHKKGPYTVKHTRNGGPRGAHNLYRPNKLGANGEKHAIITWGNGTGATPAAYGGLLQHLATHGFVVIASNSTQTGSGKQMAEGVTWLLEQNEKSGSEFYHKLNPDVAGATGHSQGGAGTIQSCKHTDKITSIAPMAPATFTAPIFYTTSHVKAVMFIMTGAADVLAMPTAVRTTSWGSFGKNGIGLFGQLKGVTHMEEMGSAGKFKKYVTAWFDATLNGNPKPIEMIFNTTSGALHSKTSEWTNILTQNLSKYTTGNETPVVAGYGNQNQIGFESGIFPFNTRVENNNLILRIPDGKQLSVDVYNIQGALLYNASFSKSFTLPINKLGAKGGYITTVKNGKQTVFKRKMMITR